MTYQISEQSSFIMGREQLEALGRAVSDALSMMTGMPAQASIFVEIYSIASRVVSVEIHYNL